MEEDDEEEEEEVSEAEAEAESESEDEAEDKAGEPLDGVAKGEEATFIPEVGSAATDE